MTDNVTQKNVAELSSDDSANGVSDVMSKKILSLLDGISYGQIEYILDNVKRQATLYPIKIELPLD